MQTSPSGVWLGRKLRMFEKRMFLKVSSIKYCMQSPTPPDATIAHDNSTIDVLKLLSKARNYLVRHLRRSIMRISLIRLQLGRKLRMFEKRMLSNFIILVTMYSHRTKTINGSSPAINI